MCVCALRCSNCVLYVCPCACMHVRGCRVKAEGQNMLSCWTEPSLQHPQCSGSDLHETSRHRVANEITPWRPVSIPFIPAVRKMSSVSNVEWNYTVTVIIGHISRFLWSLVNQMDPSGCSAFGGDAALSFSHSCIFQMNVLIHNTVQNLVANGQHPDFIGCQNKWLHL